MRIVAGVGVALLLTAGIGLLAIGLPLLLDYITTGELIERVLFGAPVTALGLSCIAAALAIVIWWPHRG
jgi:hypothetical protein